MWGLGGDCVVFGGSCWGVVGCGILVGVGCSWIGVVVFVVWDIGWWCGFLLVGCWVLVDGVLVGVVWMVWYVLGWVVWCWCVRYWFGLCGEYFVVCWV